MERGAFISYSSKDSEFVRKLAKDLTAHGISVWFDERELEPGDSIIGTIEAGIDRMEFLIVVLSPTSVDSPWVTEEVRMALHEGIAGKKITVIPVLRKDCRIPGFLRDKKHVDMRKGADYKAGLEQLVLKISRGIQFKDSLPTLQDELTNLQEGRTELERQTGGDTDQVIEKVMFLTQQAIRREIDEGEWKKIAAPLMLSLGKANVAFDQRKQQITTQINIGSLTLTQPSISKDIDPKALSKFEEDFRHRIKKRFKEDAPCYIQLAGETTEPAPIVDDEKVPRSARRCRQRIKAEYCEWIPVEREIKRVKLNSLREAIDKYPCVILLGDPGCGKTTSLEYLAYELAEDTNRLPLPLRLSEFAPEMSVEDFIVDGWAGPGGSGHWNAPELAGRLIAYLESGSLFFLFDALNEMPQERYAARVRALRDFINKWSPKGNRFLVTCRELDYGEDLSGLQRLEVQPLDDDKVKAFVKMELPKTWEDFWRKLIDEKDSQRQLIEFARNPYMLTVMIDIFNKDGRLGRNRSELMERFTEILMGRAKETCPPRNWLGAEIQRESLGVMAFEIQNRTGFGTMVKTDQALSVMPSEAQPDPKWPRVQAPPQKVLALAASAHLIEMTGDRSSLRFYHQLLQEYYAAHAMLKKKPSALKDKWRWPWLESEMPKWVRPEKNYDPLPPPPPTGWEETTIMAAGLKLENEDQLVLAVNAVNPVLAGRCLHEGRAGVRPAVRKAVVDRLLAAISDPKVALRARIAAGGVLGYLGDPRIGELVEVRAGKFTMGDNREEIEKPQHVLFLPDYQIGKYPVTNAEFSGFMQDGGYEETRWWTEAGFAARREDGWSQPRSWNDSRFNRPNQPVVNVSWYECLAYCNWKRATTKVPYKLPSESEWEKAARGSDRRRFPWGDKFDASRLNNIDGEQVVWSTTPVGVYPTGVSPTGCLDMAGNVWEWTSSLWGENWDEPDFKYPYQPDDGREKLEVGNKSLRVLRGGSWFDDRYFARCSYRCRYIPNSRSGNLGFRVVVSPFFRPSAL